MRNGVFVMLNSVQHLWFLVYLTCLVEKIEIPKQVRNDNVIIQNQKSSIRCNDLMTKSFPNPNSEIQNPKCLYPVMLNLSQHLCFSMT